MTAFSSEYHGDSVVTGERSPGGTCVYVHVVAWKNDIFGLITVHLEYYHVKSSSQNVGFAMPSTVVFFIGLNLKV